MSVESDRSSTRRSGILLPVSALPGPSAVGTFGPEVDRWLEWLEGAKQSVWQVLPLGPTTAFAGDSPYSALSAFAIDPIYISLEALAAEGRLESFEAPDEPRDQVDYARERAVRAEPLRSAFERWRAEGGEGEAAYLEFVETNASWLPDYALFVALRSRGGSVAWFDWDEPLRRRDAEALTAAREEHADRVDFEVFLQFTADRQWRSVRERCAARGIELFGDLPIYVSWDSADVWVEQADFELDEAGRPTVVSGVPPDYFTEKGQRWGNPLFRWAAMADGGYRWWIDRLRRNGRLFDFVRLDHFRGFESFWEIAVEQTDAVEGRWVEGPGAAFFAAVEEALPELRLVAEDLGVITDGVRQLRRTAGLPGMRVLQFAFGEDFPDNEHIPHRFDRETVLYTGTHDNNTLLGWFREELSPEDRKRLRRYVGRGVSANTVHRRLGRLALASVADLVILPLQDVLGLDAATRINRPGAAEGNWRWRALADDLAGSAGKSAQQRLGTWTETYGRAPERRGSKAQDEAPADEAVERSESGDETPPDPPTATS